jgi:adenine phosphoribosyltransferase
VAPGARVLVVDDGLATGGTAAAACDVVAAVGARVVGFAALIELVALGGRTRLRDVPVHALLTY